MFFHKPVLLSVSMRFTSKWGTTVWTSLYYITMPVINQAKKQKKIEHFPYTTWNPLWSCSILAFPRNPWQPQELPLPVDWNEQRKFLGLPEKDYAAG